MHRIVTELLIAKLDLLDAISFDDLGYTQQPLEEMEVLSITDDHDRFESRITLCRLL